MTRLRADLLLLFAAVIWGSAFYFQKLAMASVGPLLFVGLRGVLAAVALAPAAMWESRRATGNAPATQRIALAGGALFFLGAIFQQYGLETATITNAGFLTALYVVLTPLALWALKREVPGPAIWLAIALAFGGTWALGGGTVGGLSRGDQLIAASAIFWAFHLIVTSASARHGRPLLFTCLQFACVGCLGLVAAAIFEPISSAGMTAALPAVLYVGLLSGALNFAILTIAMRHVPASEAAILVSMETVVTAVVGYVLLDERLSWLGWIGAAMMLAAILIVQLRRKPAPP